jgi:metal-responsive CopG/Arc/MetJ family transcriptional regulator
MNNRPKTKGDRFTIRLPKNLDLKILANSLGASRSDVISTALLEFAEKHRDKIAA